MLDNDKTLKQFGYDVSLLSNGAHKKVILICDYCDKEYDKAYKDRNKSNKIIDKDACWNCRFKKREEISLKQYGVKNSAQRQEVRKQISLVNSDRLKSDEFKEQAKATNLRKYGVEIAIHNKDIKERRDKTIKDRYGVDNISQIKDLREIATQHMIQTKIQNGTIKLYNGKTRPEVAKELGFSRGHFGKLVVTYGFETAVKMEPHTSSLETLVMHWLDSINIEYIRQYKVENKIADIYIPAHKLIIETDGLYWHSDAVIDDKNYHSDKRQLYINSGYTPLFFRENELINEQKFKIVQSIIKNKLNLSQKIFGRKCIIASIDKTVAKQFFRTNHLMGNGSGRSWGLFYEGKLVAAIQIRGHKDGYEISRFCNILDFSVIGGFSKLLNFVDENILNNKSLITFIDLRYGSGNYLTNLGFVYKNTYPSFKWTDGQNIYNRMQFPSISGYEKGLFRLWDCGQAKWILN